MPPTLCAPVPDICAVISVGPLNYAPVIRSSAWMLK